MKNPKKIEKYKHDFSHLNISLFYKSRKWHNDRMVLNGEQPNAVTYTSLLIMWSKSRLPIAKERILSVGIILDDISIYCILFIFACLQCMLRFSQLFDIILYQYCFSSMRLYIYISTDIYISTCIFFHAWTSKFNSTLSNINFIIWFNTVMNAC